VCAFVFFVFWSTRRLKHCDQKNNFGNRYIPEMLSLQLVLLVTVLSTQEAAEAPANVVPLTILNDSMPFLFRGTNPSWYHFDPDEVAKCLAKLPDNSTELTMANIQLGKGTPVNFTVSSISLDGGYWKDEHGCCSSDWVNLFYYYC
jgi:hypothetical protein